uniref:Uncharacterized protein n=1 Tax=Anguilla anguilla TaxID=7936 RepID=A0A0E9V1V0_ANGAN
MKTLRNLCKWRGGGNKQTNRCALLCRPAACCTRADWVP